MLETTLAILEPLITEHDVGETFICSASVFHELALEEAHTMLEPHEGQLLIVIEMSFTSPLIYVPSQKADVVTVYITKYDLASEADFKITSCSTKDLTMNIHCTGNVSLQNFQINASH